MLNTSLTFPFTFPPSSPFLPSPFHGFHPTMIFLLLLHFLAFLLSNLFSFLHRRAISKRDDNLCISDHENNFLSSAAAISDELYRRDETDSKDQILESEYGSPQGNISNATNETGTSDCSVSSASNKIENEEIVKIDLKKKDLLEAEVTNFRVETFGGSLTGESTSKSSIEWRSSAIFRDSETEYPFSSSSRRSDSNWEFYTLFKKYDEEMFYFDRISAQKLAETESFRLINAQPRSISKRIVGKLMGKPGSNLMRMKDPYQDLESAYVAQICLAWEALNWNYNIFLRSKGNRLDMDGSVCHARIAQRFQQFQVLLQRFIENEPYEYGRRPEIFARMRMSSPKLLQVPEFLGDEENESNISSAEFHSILEEGIQTFMSFLKADKKTRCEKLKAFIKRKQSAADLTYLRLLKKINKQKKVRMEEIGKRRKYWKKRKPKGEEEMETFMAIIDMKVVSRVLRVQEITEEQLHWCEDKMSKVRVWDGKMQRDQSPLFFPVH